VAAALPWTLSDTHSRVIQEFATNRFEYVEICGWTLARAHARTGDAAMIGGYLGKNATFDSALTKFAASYADQAESDHATLLKAIRAGQLKAQDNAAA
jgi:NAD(P)H-dependent flavin oxidoreductase YrpB (nitropropane dioxygenase family)